MDTENPARQGTPGSKEARESAGAGVCLRGDARILLPTPQITLRIEEVGTVAEINRLGGDVFEDGRTEAVVEVASGCLGRLLATWTYTEAPAATLAPVGKMKPRRVWVFVASCRVAESRTHQPARFTEAVPCW